jgi:hypothetical protein
LKTRALVGYTGQARHGSQTVVKFTPKRLALAEAKGGALAANEALNIVDGPLGVRGGLILGGLAD